MIQYNYDRMEDKIKYLIRFGDTVKGGITKIPLSQEDLTARKEFVKYMKALSSSIATDNMANIYATIAGTEICQLFSQDLICILYGKVEIMIAF